MDSKTKASIKYDKANTKNFTLKLNLKYDKDILSWLKTLDNKQGKIKELIRKEIGSK